MRRFVLFSAGLLITGALVYFIANRTTNPSNPTPQSPAPKPNGVAENAGSVTPGPEPAESNEASSKKATNPNAVAPRPNAPPKTTDKTAETSKTPSEMNYGHFQPVKGDTSPQTASVMDALKTKTHLERLSAMMDCPPFNKADYDSDPAKYCAEVVPGRAFQSAPPAPNVPELKPASNTLAIMGQNDAVKLTVKSTPGSPVSWLSTDGGWFSESKLSAVTVQADKDGNASATFIGGPGTIGNVNIVCASPMTSGQVQYRVVVKGAGVVTKK